MRVCSLAVSVPPMTLLSVDNLTSAGSVLRGNTFNGTLSGARWKSSNSLITGNTFARMNRPDLEVTSLRQWFEGPTVIDNVTISGAPH